MSHVRSIYGQSGVWENALPNDVDSSTVDHDRWRLLGASERRRVGRFALLTYVSHWTWLITFCWSVHRGLSTLSVRCMMSCNYRRRRFCNDPTLSSWTRLCVGWKGAARLARKGVAPLARQEARSGHDLQRGSLAAPRAIRWSGHRHTPGFRTPRRTTDASTTLLRLPKTFLRTAKQVMRLPRVILPSRQLMQRMRQPLPPPLLLLLSLPFPSLSTPTLFFRSKATSARPGTNELAYMRLLAAGLLTKPPLTFAQNKKVGPWSTERFVDPARKWHATNLTHLHIGRVSKCLGYFPWFVFKRLNVRRPNGLAELVNSLIRLVGWCAG